MKGRYQIMYCSVVCCFGVMNKYITVKPLGPTMLQRAYMQWLKVSLCVRSSNCVESDGARTRQQCQLLSHGDADAPPQSVSASELQLQLDDAVSTAAAGPRTVKTRRCKKSSKAGVYAFADPLSKATRSMNLSKLARSEFDWRTLTAIRPTTELEERFITRLVELERLQVLYQTTR